MSACLPNNGRVFFTQLSPTNRVVLLVTEGQVSAWSNLGRPKNFLHDVTRINNPTVVSG